MEKQALGMMLIGGGACAGRHHLAQSGYTLPAVLNFGDTLGQGRSSGCFRSQACT